LNSQRVLLLEENRIVASAIKQMILQAGSLVVGPVHDLEEALKRAEANEVDLAILQMELSDGTDATPVAQVLTARHIPYAFLVEPGDTVDTDAFPEAVYLRKPMSDMLIDDALAKLSNVAVNLGKRPAPPGVDSMQTSVVRELKDVVFSAKSGHTAELESRILGHGRIPTKLNEEGGEVRYVVKAVSEDEIEDLRSGLYVAVTDVDD
jgi:CheY-like chemotaxis protein